MLAGMGLKRLSGAGVTCIYPVGVARRHCVYGYASSVQGYKRERGCVYVCGCVCVRVRVKMGCRVTNAGFRNSMVESGALPMQCEVPG